MFDIHKVKPVHGWREFIGEVGIIVLGVLIALAAEQLVETLHWKSEVNETKQSLNISLASSRVSAIERIYLNHCMNMQIKAVEKHITDGATTPIKVIGTPMRPWQESPWTTASNSGVISHMSSELRTNYARAFDSVEILSKANKDEFTVWGDLTSLNYDPHVTAVSRDRLESDLARARFLNFLVVTASKQLDDEAKKLGVHLGPENAADLRQVIAVGCAYHS